MINKPLWYLFLAFTLTSFGCEKSNSPNQESDRQELAALLQDIENMANQVPCENDGDWKFAPVGAKACGGPTHFIAYAKKINESAFLEKIRLYTNKQLAFNERWNIRSTCDAPQPPKSVTCVNAKPKFVY